MRTTDIVQACTVLESAKLTKMEDKDKFIVIKAIRKLKAVRDDFKKLVEEAQERLRPEDYDTYLEKLMRQRESDTALYTEKEQADINRFFTEYNEKIERCVREEAEKDIPLDYEKLSEDGFGKLLASNDWTLSEILTLQDALL